MKAIINLKFETQNVKAAISQSNLWISEYKSHVKSYPDEKPYTQRLIGFIKDVYRLLLNVEPYFDRPVLRDAYHKRYIKNKSEIESILKNIRL